MWFAALGTYERNYWFVALAGRLLEQTDNDVWQLPRANPTKDGPMGPAPVAWNQAREASLALLRAAPGSEASSEASPSGVSRVPAAAAARSASSGVVCRTR